MQRTGPAALKERDIEGDNVPLARAGKAAVVSHPEELPRQGRHGREARERRGPETLTQVSKWMAETPVGWIKEVLGLRRFIS